MKTFLKIAAFLLCCLAGVSLWLWHEAASFLETPARADGREIYFDVPKGASLSAVADSLAKAGLVSDARKFRLYARFKGDGKSLQAGRFAMNTGWTPPRVLDELVNGKPALNRLTVPEGLTWWQTGRLLAANGLARFEDFRDVIHDPAFLRRYGIPFANAEGFLMPDTYLLRPADAPPEDAAAREAFWKERARAMAGRMIDNFWRKSATLWPGAAGKSAAWPVQLRPDDATLRTLMTLASIVEKETAIDAERPRVAGVYHNRIRIGMPLQADPTVIYGMGPNFAGPLLRRHLEDKANPYNTYQLRGLPPGPIASFGMAALKAAIQPEANDYYYFVAKTDGGAHRFSRTLAEHNEAVRAYQMQKRGK